MADNLKNAVKDSYGRVAGSGRGSRVQGVRAIAQAFGYSGDELASIPAAANMALSCGNPIAFASLKPGEVVVDLGCGGGLDVFLAARKLGPTGRVIGIDMTPQMIELTGRNLVQFQSETKGTAAAVELHLADIEKLPLPDSSVDCIISNCVINLASDKNAVFREAARVLKPGGRFAVSDIALKQPLPAGLATDVLAHVGCIAGAISMEDYRRGLLKAGFSAVEVMDSGADLNAYSQLEGRSACCASPTADASPGLAVLSSCCGASPSTGNDVHAGLKSVMESYNVNEFAASVRIYAVKSA